MRLVVAVVLALLLGAGLGVAVDRLALDTDGPAATGAGALESLPDGPVAMQVSTVTLPAGFRSRHVHGGPTLNSLVSGRVEISDADGTRTYGPGDFFFEPAGVAHTIVVLEDARLDVVRLLPPGVEATTEVSG